jgi:hypothetical protein
MGTVPVRVNLLNRERRLTNGTGCTSDRYCPIRDLGAVKGGEGLKHHEVVVDFTRRDLFRFALKYPQSRRPGWTEQSSREASSWRHNCSQDATGVSG